MNNYNKNNINNNNNNNNINNNNNNNHSRLEVYDSLAYLTEPLDVERCLAYD